jgi:hypothetical protein
MIVVELTKDEYTAAAAVGEKRQKMHGEHGGTRLERDQIGAVAEYALAKHLGADVLRDWAENKAYTDGDPKLILADVGKCLQVRATKKSAGNLIVKKGDRATDVFVLARVDPTRHTVTFVGWQFGRNCQRATFWRDQGPGYGFQAAYLVDEDVLNDMDTLPPEAVR